MNESTNISHTIAIPAFKGGEPLYDRDIKRREDVRSLFWALIEHQYMLTEYGLTYLYDHFGEEILMNIVFEEKKECKDFSFVEDEKCLYNWLHGNVYEEDERT